MKNLREERDESKGGNIRIAMESYCPHYHWGGGGCFLWGVWGKRRDLDGNENFFNHVQGSFTKRTKHQHHSLSKTKVGTGKKEERAVGGKTKERRREERK